MIDIFPWRVRAPLVLGLAAALALPPVANAQLPGPIDGLDEHTVALGTFNTSVALEGPGGENLIKSTGFRHPAGMFGTSALSLPPEGGVSIHASDGFSVTEGTIEMWVRRGGATEMRQSLFSLQGVSTIDGGPEKALIVGEITEQGPAMSRVLFHTEQGLQPASMARFRSNVPRGISVGDVDGDGARDMVVSMNAGDRVDIILGPVTPGALLTSADISLAVPEPQGNSLADLDGDGDLDLLVCSFASSTAPIYGFENRGDGTWLALDLAFFGFNAFAEGMAVGDVDRDGVLDVLYASLDTTLPSAVLLGQLDEEGRWTVDVTDDDGFSSLSFVCLGAGLADIDRDGWLDVVLSRPLNDEVVVHLNGQDGTFRFMPDMVIPTAAPFTLAVDKDVNNDGYLDIAVANWRTVANQDSFSSRIHLGPDFTGSLGFPVENAVSLTLGDIDGDGWHDLFLRSSTGPASRLYYLDMDASVRGSQSLATSPTTTDAGAPHGAGIGVFAAISGGTTPYASVLDRSNSFDLFLEGGEVVFRITDSHDRVHQVTAPFEYRGGGPGGYRHVAAEWSLHLGQLQLRVLPAPDAMIHAYQADGPIEVTFVSPLLRLGTDADNQRPCRGCRYDDVRISDVRRSQLAVEFAPSDP